MEITHGSQMKFEDPGAKHRPGGLAFKTLSRGTEGSLENHLFVLARQEGFYSPRHKHNFDQFRYAIKGNFNLAPNIDLHEGSLAYHPEGVHYGPQDDGKDEMILLVLQFGGASGQGFLSLDQIRAANAELLKKGKFEKGKYYADDRGEGDEPVDGFEAAWTLVNGRQLVYPEPRYNAPIIMNPASFKWRDRGQSAQQKVLGTFSERQVSVKMLKLGEGGRLSVDEGAEPSMQLLYVIKGSGKVGDKAIQQESCIRLLPGASCTIESGGHLELLHFTIPLLGD